VRADYRRADGLRYTFIPEAMREIRINHRLVIPPHEIRESFVTSSGPGGQNVNKLATKVELRWSPKESTIFRAMEHRYLLERLASRLTDKGELLITCDHHRTQMRNREEARTKLAHIVGQALHRPKKRVATKPSKGSVRRRLDRKSRRSAIKKSRTKYREE